ncbi:MAG: hypothetical protein JJ992_29125 [Planctomycetes bacterium]|nr:hypothetical protein [Planctomycetota bacterium]
MRLTPIWFISVSIAVAGCTADEFATAYTDAALAPTGPTPEQMIDDDIERAGKEAVRGVDTTDFQALE